MHASRDAGALQGGIGTPVKLANPPDSSDLDQTIKEYLIPSTQNAEGQHVPLSPVVIVDPSSNPARLVPQGWWLYHARRVATNTNAAGAAIAIDITMNPGQVGRIVSMEATQTTTATHTLLIRLLDENLAVENQLATGGAAAASNYCFLPSVGTAATASANYINTVGFMVPPGSILTSGPGDASGVANDTCTVDIIILLSTPDIPVWSVARSGNPAQTTLAASTISAPNTLIKVDLPW